MSVYLVVTYDIADPKAYETYPAGVLPLVLKHGAEVLVADYAAQAIEGRAPSVTVVLRFKSEEAARTWYNDPAYTPVKKIRLDSTRNTCIVLAKEFTPPSA